MPGLVSVIVVNMNGRHFLERCLSSLLAQAYSPVEIILVDNASTDGSQAWVAEHFASVRVIANAANRGFAAANNQGIAVAEGDYIALLNNDAWVERDWLQRLVAAAETDARIGMVAPLMVLADRPELIDSAGAAVDRCGITWNRAGGRSVELATSVHEAMLGPSAGAALYRRQLLDEVHGFDEDYFMYLEDVDLAWRARWLGWQAAFVPGARVYHVHSGTSGQGSAFKTYWLARNKIRLIARNYPLPQLWRYLPLILMYDSLSLMATILRGQGRSGLRGRWAGWRALPGAWRKRRAFDQRMVSGRQIHQLLAGSVWPWQAARRYQHLDARSPASPTTTATI
jgi:GT2 family glycosyltransferase